MNRPDTDRAPKPCQHKQARHVHGTYACYVQDRCRCRPCADANSTYVRNRVRQQAYGRWNGLVDAEPARTHVKELMAAGMGIKQVARAAGLHGGTMAKLLYGHQGRPPSRRIRPATAAKLLAVRLTLAPGAIIDSRGTRRRLQALSCLGWSIQALADRYGVDRQRLDGALRGRDVQAGTATIVATMFDDLWNTRPPETTHRQRISASRARNTAERNSWTPPLGWDDIDRDDAPQTGEHITLDHIAITELIAGHKHITGSDEYRAAALILTEQGRSANHIADLLGVSGRTVTRWRKDAAA